MRPLIITLMLLLIPALANSRQRRDTVYTGEGDKIIMKYDYSVDGSDMTLSFSAPRIIPSERLKEDCKGDNGRLKAVVFSRVGDFGRVKWRGLTPMAFTVPPGISYSASGNGYFILGESEPLNFSIGNSDNNALKFPVYIAVYEKTRTYRIVAQSLKPLVVSVGKAAVRSVSAGRGNTALETERIMVKTTVEGFEGDNEETLNVLASIDMVREMLASETEYPLSESIRMEIYNLRAAKERVKNADIVGIINNLLLECSQKERMLKEQAQNDAMSAEAHAKAEQARLAKEEKERLKVQEAEAKIQQEQQQKRTIWMIVGGVIIAILGFMGNALFKHFQNIRNQRNIMEMQESIARQAQHEAGRRAQEIVRNKAHAAVNKTRSKVRKGVAARSSGNRSDAGANDASRSVSGRRPGVNTMSRGISDNNRKTI